MNSGKNNFRNICIIEIDFGKEKNFEEVSQIATEELLKTLHKLSDDIPDMDVKLRFAVMPEKDIEVKFNG